VSVSASVGYGRAGRLGLVAVATAGTVDVAQFILSSPAMFQSAPGRATGSVVGLAVWLALTGCATAGAAGVSRRELRTATLGLAGLAAVGSVGLTAIHAAAHVGGLRPALGGVLGLSALALAWVTRRP